MTLASIFAWFLAHAECLPADAGKLCRVIDSGYVCYADVVDGQVADLHCRRGTR